MKVLKKFLIVFALFCAACVSQADDLLFWFIDEEAPEFDYAKMMIGIDDNGTITGGGYVSHIGYDWEDDYIYDERPDWPPSVQAALIGSDYAGMSFMVELYNANDELTHTSRIYNFGELQEYIVAYEDFSAAWRHIEPLQVFPFTGSDAVPEPTSGMLILVGAALLALRRGRVGG